MEALKQYKEDLNLHNDGVISDDEFDTLKTVLFNKQKSARGGIQDELEFENRMQNAVFAEDLEKNAKSYEQSEFEYTKKPFFKRNCLTAEEFAAFEASFNKRWDELSRIHKLK